MVLHRWLHSFRVLCLLFLLLQEQKCAGSPGPNTRQNQDDNITCQCMDYWVCVLNGGVARGMCPMSSKFCCFLASSESSIKGEQNIEKLGEQKSSRTSGKSAHAHIKPLNQLSLLPSLNLLHINRKHGSQKLNNQADGDCGMKGAGITGDSLAEPAEWPWHAAILESARDLYVCGASVIDKNWLLTAAHCVDEYINRAEMLKCRLGEFDVTNTDELLPHQESTVDSIFLHPSFNNNTLLNDLALVHIRDAAVVDQSNIAKICLPERPRNPLTISHRASENHQQMALGTLSHVSHTTCIVTGWGRFNESSDHSSVLKEISVPLWNSEQCTKALRKQFGSHWKLAETSVCAGQEHHDACDGDGGGPLVCLDPVNSSTSSTRWRQVGVVSFGIGCGRQQTPGVYTRVDRYLDWINSVLHRV